jgi:hypothetical protein
MTTDIDTVMNCDASIDQTACMQKPVCQWYKGKSVSSNIDLVPGSKFLENNFCHPVSNALWNTQAPTCLKEQN